MGDCFSLYSVAVYYVRPTLGQKIAQRGTLDHGIHCLVARPARFASPIILIWKPSSMTQQESGHVLKIDLFRAHVPF